MSSRVTSARIKRIAWRISRFRLRRRAVFAHTIAKASLFETLDIIGAREALSHCGRNLTVVAAIVVSVAALRARSQLAVVIAAFVQALSPWEAGVALFAVFNAIIAAIGFTFDFEALFFCF